MSSRMVTVIEIHLDLAIWPVLNFDTAIHKKSLLACVREFFFIFQNSLFMNMKEGVAALAKVEEAYRHERHTKEAIEEVIQSRSLYQLRDTLEAAEDGREENRLLPAMNKIWPFLVVCVQNKNPVVRVFFF